MLTIIVKGTNGCNLACSYCSLGKKENFKYICKSTLYDLFAYSCRFAVEQKKSAIKFILHGGEPTLIRANVYQNVIDQIKEEFSDLKIVISMQSNGLSITPEYMNFLLQNDVHVGISLDGSEEIHDLERRSAGGTPTYKIIEKNIENMLNMGIQVSCLMVLTKNAFDKGYDFLKFYERNNLHLKINPLINYGEAYKHPELTLKSGDYANYLIDMYKYIISNDINVNVSPIDNIIHAIIYKHYLSECTFNKECNKHFLCIDYSGDIYPCGKFSDANSYKIGNIYNTDVKLIHESCLDKLLERRNHQLPQKCTGCKYLRLCNGGCTAEAAIEGNINGVPFLCEDYRQLFDYFSKDGLILLKKELLRQKKYLEELK